MKKMFRLFLLCILLLSFNTSFAQQCTTTWISNNVSGAKSYSASLNFTLQVPPGSTIIELGYVVAKDKVKNKISTFSLDDVNKLNQQYQAYYGSGKTKAVDFPVFVFCLPSAYIQQTNEIPRYNNYSPFYSYNKMTGLIQFSLPIGGKNPPSVILKCDSIYYYAPYAIFKNSPNCSSITNAIFDIPSQNYFCLKKIDLSSASLDQFKLRFTAGEDRILNNFVPNSSGCLTYNTYLGEGLLPVAGGDGLNYRYRWQLKVDGGAFNELNKETDKPEGLITSFPENLDRRVPHLLSFRRNVYQEGCPSNNSISNAVIWTLPPYSLKGQGPALPITITPKSNPDASITLSVTLTGFPKEVPRSNFQWEEVLLFYPWSGGWVKYTGPGANTDNIKIPSGERPKAYRCTLILGQCYEMKYISNTYENK